MVERDSLLLTPWTESTADAAELRQVADAATGAVLGSMRRVRASTRWGCKPARMDVCETEDQSLLMSIEHGWFAFGRWQIFDAERRCVGAVVGRHLLDQSGGRFATVWHEQGAAAAIRSRQGQLLARLETRAGRVEALRFADDLPSNPFMRMVLMAAWVLQAI